MIVIHDCGACAVVTTLVGGKSGTNGIFADGTGSNAGFNGPFSVAVDSSGTIYACDSSNQRIRRVTPGGGMSWDGCFI